MKQPPELRRDELRHWTAEWGAVSTRRFVLTHAASLAAILLVGLLPILSVLAAGSLASSLGCRLDEAGSYPCILFGTDIGGVLSAMNVMGWLMLMSVPLGMALLALWLALFLLHLVLIVGARRRQR